MEDGDGGDLTPFWVQSTTNARRGDRLRRRAAAVLLSSGLVVFLLLVTAVFFLVFIVPSTISLSSQIFRPNSVKKSWDSLNIFLVLVAVVFGFLSRNKNEERFNNYVEFQDSPSKQDGIKSSYETFERRKSNISNSNNWYEYSDYEAKLEHKNSILTRNSSSYPDLRDFPATDWSYGDYYRTRYFDDIHVDTGRVWISDPDPDPGRSSFHRRHRSLEAVEHLRAPPQSKTFVVDTLLTKSKRGEINQPPPSVAAAVAAPCPEENLKMRDVSGARLKEEVSEPSDPIKAQRSPAATAAEESAVPEESVERSYQKGAWRKEKSGRKRKKDAEVTPPPAPPPPPSQKSSNSDRKRNPTKDFLNSLYQKRKKKPRQKSADHLDPLLHEAQTPSIFQIPPPTPPPPPPPPLPPPSVVQNLFSSKIHKSKRIITVTLTPQLEPTSEPAPAPPETDESPPNPAESPLNFIPPPPPPPPAGFFKTPAWKFVVQGDYVRIDSIESSRSGSPDTDDGDSPNFCRSPDVNTKAESFITNFRAKLKMEKIHSMKKREVGLSGLGPGAGERK
ncbi:hydroxyproline-rich glycoprotein family protein [Striga asiatica]|uniref:Hydroxyproline-rich glycoprotein family protein n=1 Tax=Striga asiatica TaxID=4170 RepID=A0A5A7P6V0_STRAF|nr:hydroxyproline-rich glycoprotein family protein [Striga asiatica]